MKVNQRDEQGQLHGFWEFYHINEEVSCKCIFRHGRVNGPCDSYYKGGGLSVRGFYKNDKSIGLWYEQKFG